MFEQYAEWGCSGIDLWNALRTQHYVNVAKLGAPGDWIYSDCIPDPDALADLLEDPVYTDPQTDAAWWYDPNRPESTGFAGLLVQSVTGMYTGTWRGEVTRTLGRAGRIGILAGADIERTITVEGELHGTSCCSVAYGFRALTQALRGCCLDPCCGQPLRVPAYLTDQLAACSPPLGGSASAPERPWRSLYGVGLIEGPEIIDGVGPRCGVCGCWPQTDVRFVLAAVNPGLHTDPTPIGEQELLSDPESPILCNICTEDAQACPDPDELLFDPECESLPAAPSAPNLVVPNCFCAPIGFRRLCFEIDTGAARWFEVLLSFMVFTGNAPLRNLRVRMWAKRPGYAIDSGYYTACNACTGFQVGYVPASSRMEVDSRTGTATIYSAGRSMNAVGQIFNLEGLPWDGKISMACGSYYVCVDSDPYSTADDATIEFTTSEVEP